MTSTLRTKGHRPSPLVVRTAGAAIVAGLAVSFFAASRTGGLVSVVALAVFAGWVGMSESRYELTDATLSFHSVLGSTTLDRNQIRTVAWDRDDMNIEELTIRGDFGRAISVSRAELDANADFERELVAFLAGEPTSVVPSSLRRVRPSVDTVLPLAG